MFWRSEYSSLLVAPQTGGFGVPNSDDAAFKALLCDKPKFAPATEITELDLLQGIIGATPERLIGRRSASLQFTIPLEGFKAGYDPTAENPGGAPVGSVDVIPHCLALLANVLGSNLALIDTAAHFWQGIHLSCSQYTAAPAVASATSTGIVLANSTASNRVKVGQLVATALGTTTDAIQFGFVKTKAVQTLTLFEACRLAIDDESANVYPTANAWVSTQCLAQVPMTFRWVGDDPTMAYVIEDGICESVKLTWEAGAVPTLEFTYKCYNFSMDKTKGGLVVPDAFVRIPQLVGSVNGRATVDGYATGGLEKCTLEWKLGIKEIKSHNAAQGVSGVVISKPRLTASFSIPHLDTAPDSTTDTVFDSSGVAGSAGSYLWQSRLERGVLTSVACYVGSDVGRLFAFLIPTGRIVAVPVLDDRDGIIAYTLTVEAAAYHGDTTDTAETPADSPINSLGRIAFG